MRGRGWGGCAFVVRWNTVGRSHVQGFAAQGGRGRHLRASPVADLDFVCQNAAKTNKRFFCALRRTQRSGNCKAGGARACVVCLSAGPGLWYGGLCNFQGLSLADALSGSLFFFSALPLARCSLSTVDYWHARSLGGACDLSLVSRVFSGATQPCMCCVRVCAMLVSPNLKKKILVTASFMYYPNLYLLLLRSSVSDVGGCSPPPSAIPQRFIVLFEEIPISRSFDASW